MSATASASIKAAVAAALTAVSASGADVAGQSTAPATALTIYSNAAPGSISPDAYRSPARGAVPGYAVVRQERDLDLMKGRNAVRFTDVAALIDPTTVAFESMTDARHNGIGAKLPVRPRQHRQAAAEVHRSSDRSRSDSRPNHRDVQRHAAVDAWRRRSAATTAPCRCSRTTPESGCRPCPAA